MVEIDQEGLQEAIRDFEKEMLDLINKFENRVKYGE